LSSEEHSAPDLVRYGSASGGNGLRVRGDLGSFSSLGRSTGPEPVRLVGSRSDRAGDRGLPVGTMVTFPIIRVHPGLVAQAAATAATWLPGRFFLSLGRGENVNEHVLGDW
jgi:coenzyme F420-dependent glucose-6-phosphate dehydrogenase